ncbi:FtsW/RodA/SpoVE family cell cycle protein [Allofustis seminis]|uniref:FtsW/RodA/SpoVE family cell cycle protein n=1 Tax=Allofustis seminis TaxID=166939 RepID=UPI00038287CC|nr:FtsW/RodA/SpoVE family cell cycle protein [Allofustis seminis]
MRDLIIERFKWMDRGILFSYVFLLIFSVLAVYSASSYVALNDYGNPGYFLLRQSVFVLIGAVAFLFAFIFPLKKLQYPRWIMWGAGITIFLLVAVYFTPPVLGARRWFNLKIITIQPAEFAKLFVVWYLAYSFSLRQVRLQKDFIQAILQPGILVALIALLMLFEPDTGTVFVIGVTAVFMAAASGASLKYAIRIVAVGVISFLSIFLIVSLFGDKLSPLLGYRYERFVGFFNPFKYADDAGHQLVNSYYALRRGGLFGVGIGKSVQKTGYLPFPYTDFILPIIGEEIGFIGLSLVLGIIFSLVSRIFLIAARTGRNFDSLLCIGIGSMLMVQIMVNAFGVTGFLPITGITFPFLSYGGSSLIVVSLATGLAANASANLAKDRQMRKNNKKGASNDGSLLH